MVLTATEEKEIEELKHKQRIEFENLRHEHEMEELEMQLKIAKEGIKSASTD
jgi:hypothetical protein